MKQILIVTAFAIIGILLWQATGKKNDIITTAAENIKMSMEIEKMLMYMVQILK